MINEEIDIKAVNKNIMKIQILKTIILLPFLILLAIFVAIKWMIKDKIKGG